MLFVCFDWLWLVDYDGCYDIDGGESVCRVDNVIYPVVFEYVRLGAGEREPSKVFHDCHDERMLYVWTGIVAAQVEKDHALPICNEGVDLGSDDCTSSRHIAGEDVAFMTVTPRTISRR